ncbi:MAG: HPr kinase/phosphorylase [Brevundimonas sp.]|uniref:HPr kinase/phosphorylase n=1 Tax=Brevundimonas sp. TaxID=1871086 RepID=UPI00391DA2BA
MTPPAELIHANAVAVRTTGPEGGWRGALLTGPSGAGKSDLSLRLIQAGWRLVADDYVRVWGVGGRLYARPPETLAGRMEVRGLGVMGAPHLEMARMVLVARCVGHPPERLPEPAFETFAGVRLPQVEIEALQPAAPARLAAALRSLGQAGPLAY